MVAALRRHLDEHGFGDIEIVVREGEPAWWTPPWTTRSSAAAAPPSEDVTGQAPGYSVSCSGHGARCTRCARSTASRSTTLGAGRDDCRAHAPDENIRIDDLGAATRITGRFLDAFARLPEVPRASPDGARLPHGRERRADPRLVAAAEQRDLERAQLAAARTPRRSSGRRS